MKKKLLITVLSVVALLLLAGVGYATWVISQNANAESEGNIVVETVSDERLEVTVAPVDPAAKSFVFGHTADAVGAANKWLTAKAGDPVENLEVAFVVTITKKGTAAAFTATTDVNVTPVYLTVFNEDFMKGLAFEETSRALENENKTLKVYFKAKISWGDLTGNANPFVYFNNLGTSDAKITSEIATAANAAIAGAALTTDSTNADYALAYLEYFHTTFDSQVFNVKVTVAYPEA